MWIYKYASHQATMSASDLSQIEQLHLDSRKAAVNDAGHASPITDEIIKNDTLRELCNAIEEMMTEISNIHKRLDAITAGEQASGPPDVGPTFTTGGDNEPMMSPPRKISRFFSSTRRNSGDLQRISISEDYVPETEEDIAARELGQASTVSPNINDTLRELCNVNKKMMTEISNIHKRLDTITAGNQASGPPDVGPTFTTGGDDEPMTSIPSSPKIIICEEFKGAMGIEPLRDREGLSDEEILEKIKKGEIKTRELDDLLKKDLLRAVSLRRRALVERLPDPRSLDNVPWQHFDYKLILGRCCEEVIGYTTVPLGFAGPLHVDGKEYYVPLATTEGCLVASTNRGCRIVEEAGGICSEIFRDGMTRAPVLKFTSIKELMECMPWIESKEGFDILKTEFDSTSSHADLKSILPIPIGCYLHLRFTSETGDAMGMNMVSKGCKQAISCLQRRFPAAKLVSLSGNTCSDKKAAAINWVLGRGKSVLVECRIPPKVLDSRLKLKAEVLAQLCLAKNFAGSAAAGALGGFNAHAANIVAAIFIATGQDPAQVVESSSCLTMMEAEPDGTLHITCTLPCLEVATIGGGTCVSGQTGCRKMLNLDPEKPAAALARIVAATVLCAELNLMAALAKDELVNAHMKFNRAPLERFQHRPWHTPQDLDEEHMADFEDPQ